MKIRDLRESKNLSSEKDSVSPGVQQLKTDQYMGMYKFSKDVAGHDGKKQHAPKSEPNKVYKDAPVVVGYSDADDKMTKAAMKGKVKQTVAAGSKEPPNVNKHSPLSKKSVAEAFQHDEANLMYRYDTDRGQLVQAMIGNRQEQQAKQRGYKDTPEQALKAQGIIRSKFDPKKFVQNQNGKWVEVFPYGQKKDVAEDGDSQGYYNEIVAAKVFSQHPDLTKEDDVLNAAWAHVVGELGPKKARHLFNYDPDFVGDLVSSYFHLQKQSVAEGKKCPQCGSTSCTCEPGKCNCKPVEEDKIKGKDGKACWKGYRYGGTEDGKDVCIKVREATVRHDRYVRSHGKKASGGHGAWMFTNKEYGEPSKDEVFSAPPGKFSDAAKHAKKWAKEKGHHTVYAMEDGLDEASIATMRKFFAGDEKAHDPSKTSTMRDFFSDPGNDNPIRPSRGKTFNSKAEYMRWLQAQKNTKENVEENVIYQLDPANPMDDTEVLVLGGAGRYTLKGLRGKARREVAQLAKDLEAEHGGAFRSAAYNIKQLANTLNTIVAAYNELTDIRKKGGAKSRGIRAEDAELFSESLDLMEKWSQKYKNSINCSNPKGFSQKAHCAGRNK